MLVSENIRREEITQTLWSKERKRIVISEQKKMTKRFPKAKINLKARSERHQMPTDLNTLRWESSCKQGSF